MRKGILLLAATALAVTPLAAQQLHYLDPHDVSDAQREHAQLIQELGGAETGPRAAYVASVGHRVAAYSGVANSDQAMHFTILNSAVDNAMSVPGGYVYITRQLLTLMDNESELAFALGHEVGHVAANHARIREAYAEHNSYGVLGQIVGAIFGNNAFGGLVQAKARMDNLSFSREQEYQADALGLRYMISAGYDPAGGPSLLAALSRQTALEARVQGQTHRQTPEWASTHPLSENRMEMALKEARSSGRLGNGVRNRDGFLSQLEGTYVDDDPAQGVIEGATFTHPDLRIRFQVPVGYLMSNGTDAVTISGSAGKAQFRGGRFSGPIDQAVLLAFRQLTGGRTNLSVAPPQHIVINGMPAAVSTARVSTSSGVVDASVAAYRWDPQHIYYFVMLTPGGYGLSPFVSMINSLRKITPADAAAIRPRIIHIVRVAPGDTIQSLANRMAYRDFKVDRFLALNGLLPGSALAPGQKVKLVIYGVRRA